MSDSFGYNWTEHALSKTWERSSFDRQWKSITIAQTLRFSAHPTLPFNVHRFCCFSCDLFFFSWPNIAVRLWPNLVCLKIKEIFSLVVVVVVVFVRIRQMRPIFCCCFHSSRPLAVVASTRLHKQSHSTYTPITSTTTAHESVNKASDFHKPCDTAWMAQLVWSRSSWVRCPSPANIPMAVWRQTSCLLYAT